MNPLVLTCLLCFVVYSRGSAQKPEATDSSALAGVSGGPASEEGLPSSVSDDDELEVNEELSGGHNQNFSIHEFHALNDEKKKRKSKGKRKNKHKSKNTTPLNPGNTSISSRYTSSASSTTQNPCTSTHLSYCIHGVCKYIEGVQEPVCICMTGYAGTRCGIQSLESVKNPPEQRNSTELVQTVLVIIAVVLSVISCIAILLMTCAHYRSHKNFLASYLGSGSEQEKLQKPVQDAVV